MADSVDAIIRKIRTKYNGVDAGSAKMNRALVRVGLILTTDAKKRSPIDLGNLRNSISFKVGKQSDTVSYLEFGSYGVPYAAYQEFGFKGSVTVRSHERMISQAFGVRIEPSRIVTVSSHQRMVDYAGKPYLRPALENNRKRIVEAIRQELSR